jgi:uncharacterized protein (TIGR04255 family)
MIVRITQNDKGAVLPPDIVMHKPMEQKMQIDAGKVITLIDTDHFVEGAWDYDLDSIMNTTHELHEAINAACFNDLITKDALEIWGAKPC